MRYGRNTIEINMVGKYQIQIGAEDFAKGLASSDYAQDGGLGTSSTGVDPFVEAGTLKGTTTSTNISTNVTGTMIASSEDSQSVSAYARLILDNDNKYYTFDGSSCTLRHSGAKSYTFGFADMVSFSNYTWVTSNADMARWNTSGGFTLTEDWWTNASFGNQSALNSSTPHPLVVFENLLWVGDKNLLHSVSSGGTVVNSALTLNENERIQALGIDPGTGLMLISTQVTQNYNDSIASRFFILLYDGYSTKVRRKIPVDELVTAFHNVGGTVYVGMGLSVGYFNGSGVTFLRKMANVTRSGTVLLYKHHFTNIGNILYVTDGSAILAFGEVMGGTDKKWFPIHSNLAGAFQIGAIGNFGSGKLGYSSVDDHLYYTTPGLTGVGIASIVTPFINFPRPVFIRKIRVFTKGITTTNANGIGSVAILGDSATYQGSGALGTFVVAAAQSPKYVFDFEFGGFKTNAAQIRVNTDTQDIRVWQIIVYYDIAE